MQNDMETKLLPLSEAACYLPKREGKKRHIMTLKRWIMRGCRGVHLVGRKVGNEWFTSVEWLRKFEADCTAQALGVTVRPAVETQLAAQRARDRRRALGLGNPPTATTSAS